MQIDLANRDGRAPWQWLFIIEGVMAIGVGILVWLVLPPFPDQISQAKHWLFTEADIELAIARSRCKLLACSWVYGGKLTSDQAYNTIGAKIDLKQVWVALKDPKSYFFASMFGAVGLATSSISLFLPTFIHAYGYSRGMPGPTLPLRHEVTEACAVRTQLFTVIPYACATVSLLVVCTLSDRLQKKGILLAGSFTTSCVGYILLITVDSIPVKLFATCLVTAGVYPAVILTVAWLGINTGGYTKRGTVWAMCEVFGQCFSILGSHIYTDAPRFVKGHAVVLAFLLWGLLNTVMAYCWMKRLNGEKERTLREFEEREELHPHVGKSLEEVYDLHVAFRYIL